MPTGSRQRGYTYLMVLFLVAALGLGAAQTGIVWHRAAEREREAELIYRAADIARALGSYRAKSPQGSPTVPQTLDELLEDKRYPMPVRHLRRVWRDPFTGQADWVLVRAGGGIVGLHSRNNGEPIRRNELPPELDPASVGAERRSEWVFRPVIAEPSAPAAE